MIAININEQSNTADGMASTLEYIACQINQGYTSGVDPTWSLSGEEEEEEPEEELKPMNYDEMIDLLETHSAIEVCKIKYERFLEVVESGGKFSIENIRSGTCALCYVNLSECKNCEITQKTGLHCSTINGSIWGNLKNAIEEGITDAVIEYTKEMIALLDSLEE